MRKKTVETNKQPSSHSSADERYTEVVAQEGERGVQSSVLPYQVYEKRFFEVEVIFRDSGDVIYHFFPKRGAFNFPISDRLFGMLLEDAFLVSVGQDAVVKGAEADYMNREEARFITRANEPDRALGQPTYYVRLTKLGTRPFAQTILVERVLARIEMLVEECARESLSGDHADHLVEKYKRARRRS